MSPQLAQILQQIVRVASAERNRLPLAEQTKLLKQLEQKKTKKQKNRTANQQLSTAMATSY